LILSFNDKGLLNPGDYELTFDEIRHSIVVLGPGDEPQWDTAWREKLVDNLEIMVKQLFAVGINDIYINGSFVQHKLHPNDIDGYFVWDVKELANGSLQRELNLLEPDKVWTWDPNSRRPYKGYTKRQLPMWHKYRVELYPHFNQPSGIVDRFGNQLQFPAAFRVERHTFEPKGIIKIVKSLKKGGSFND